MGTTEQWKLLGVPLSPFSVEIWLISSLTSHRWGQPCQIITLPCLFYDASYSSCLSALACGFALGMKDCGYQTIFLLHLPLEHIPQGVGICMHILCNSPPSLSPLFLSLVRRDILFWTMWGGGEGRLAGIDIPIFITSCTNEQYSLVPRSFELMGGERAWYPLNVHALIFFFLYNML